MAKTKLQNCLKTGFGSVLGLIWERLGTVWGLSGPLLGDFCSYFERSKSSFFQAWLQDGLQEAFWVEFGRVLEGFGEDLGKVWGEIWEDLDVFFQLVAKFWKHLGKFGPAVAKLLNWTPALIREASQCAGVPPQRG